MEDETLQSENMVLRLPPLDAKIVYLDFKHDEEKLAYDKLLKKGKDLSDRGGKGIIGIFNQCRQACISSNMSDIYEKLREGKRSHGSDDGDDDNDVHMVEGNRELGNGRSEEFGEIMSTKIAYIIEYMKEKKNAKGKFIIFCKWLIAMELLATELRREKIRVDCYDGTMNKEARNQVIWNFKKSNLQGLIIQIDAGGQGLNLQEAQHVFNVSHDWNPSLEAQSIHRVWRRGQDKQVHYRRLIIKHTVEEYCENTQEMKLDMIEKVLHEGSMATRLGNKTKGRTLSKGEMMEFFQKSYADRKRSQEEPTREVVIPTAEIQVMIQADEAAGSADATDMIPAAQAVSMIPAAQAVSMIPAAVSMIPAAQAVRMIPAAVSMIPAAQAVSMIPAAQAVSMIPAAQAVRMIPAAQAVSMIPAPCDGITPLTAEQACAFAYLFT